jgi:hypothetical protein
VSLCSFPFSSYIFRVCFTDSSCKVARFSLPETFIHRYGVGVGSKGKPVKKNGKKKKKKLLFPYIPFFSHIFSVVKLGFKKKRSRQEGMDERSDADKLDEVLLPGFRFHPTDEELVGFYLKRKIQQRPLSIELIKQLDIYKYDPWDLPSKIN